ncbi:ATP-binding protein [Domibacillus robiginosus]|uniref:sensor histidine kinase n=1 Tax=Domibacillus robiginosus TaxID=1071054 RepID=UPI00067CC038|nr:ATP-binding protein [Domibacillus robiginosus]
MTLKRRYQLLLFSAVLSVPFSLMLINMVMMVIYQLSDSSEEVPFHESFAYPVMMLLFCFSFFLLAFLFSTSINSLLLKINTLNETIRSLASKEELPSKLEIKQKDELGELIKSVNLLIDRTAYRELELWQQEESKKELLQKLRHDINTPLTAVRLQLFYIENQYDGNESLFKSLYKQIDYIAELTNEFNLQSAETLENSYLLTQEIVINDLLGSMVSKWSYLYSIHGIELVYQPADKTLSWTSNELWLQRLFDNVFQNTLKHAEATKLEVKIVDGVVSLQDNGVGFDSSRGQEGLGLKIIDDVTRLLHLTYKLESGKHGTSFYFASQAEVR